MLYPGSYGCQSLINFFGPVAHMFFGGRNENCYVINSGNSREKPGKSPGALMFPNLIAPDAVLSSLPGRVFEQAE